ncbi:MAG: hypothetical protein K2G89_02605 [Lachnospiraceae bacterium]|nr:hypothetical protein [Lachnospiraceae bacterium]
MKHNHKEQKLINGLTAFFLVLLYTLVLNHFHLPASIRCHFMDAPSQIAAYYDANKQLVELHFDSLHYTGIDYYRDNAKTGAYYYYEFADTENKAQIFQGRYVLVLVKTTTGQEVLTDYTCRCRITDGGGRIGSVLSALSAGGRIQYTDMEQMFLPLVFSEADYPGTFITLTYIFLVLAQLGIIVFFLATMTEIPFLKKRQPKESQLL